MIHVDSLAFFLYVSRFNIPFSRFIHQFHILAFFHVAEMKWTKKNSSNYVVVRSFCLFNGLCSIDNINVWNFVFPLSFHHFFQYEKKRQRIGLILFDFHSSFRFGKRKQLRQKKWKKAKFMMMFTSSFHFGFSWDIFFPIHLSIYLLRIQLDWNPFHINVFRV